MKATKKLERVYNWFMCEWIKELQTKMLGRIWFCYFHILIIKKQKNPHKVSNIKLHIPWGLWVSHASLQRIIKTTHQSIIQKACFHLIANVNSFLLFHTAAPSQLQGTIQCHFSWCVSTSCRSIVSHMQLFSPLWYLYMPGLFLPLVSLKHEIALNGCKYLHW